MLHSHTVTVDTYAVIEALRADNKFTKEQAKAIVDTIRSVELYGVATSMQLQDVRNDLKEDIQGVEEKLQDVKDELKENIQDVRDELKEDAQRLEAKIHGVEIKLSDFRGEIFKWGGTLMAGLYAMVVGILLKLFGAL